MNNPLIFECVHDFIIEKELAFKRGKFYTIVTPNGLLGENDKAYTIKEKDLNYYFQCNSIDEIEDKNVNHPKHYTWLKEKCGIEVIDITRHLDFDLGNAIKYILRAGRKNENSFSNKRKEIEDLKKAIWYLNDKIKMIENEK